MSMLALENTHNTSGGAVWPLDELRATVAAARELGLRAHLDGARLMNAAVASRRPGGRDRGAVRHRHAVPLEGARLPARRADRRLARADAPRAHREAPLRRRDAPGRDRRRGRALRARPQRRAARRRPRARAAARRGLGGGRAAGRPRARRDELRPGRRRRARARLEPRRSSGSRRRACCSRTTRPGRAARRHAPRHRRRRHRAGDRRPCRGALGQRVVRRLEHASTACSQERQADRLPSVAAAVVAQGRDRCGRTRSAARATTRRREATPGHAVPHRLDHEDVHRGRDHAAARRGQARPRRPARAAPRRDRERLADDPADARAPLRAAARGGRDVRRRRRRRPRTICVDAAFALAAGAGAPLLEPRLRAARPGRRREERHAVHGVRRRADPRAARARAHDVVRRRRRRRRATSSTSTRAPSGRSRRPTSAASPRWASSGRRSGTSRAGRRSSPRGRRRRARRERRSRRCGSRR